MIHPSERQAIEDAAETFTAKYPNSPVSALHCMLTAAFRAGAEHGLNMLKDPPRNDASRSYVVRSHDVTGGEQPYGFDLIGAELWLNIARPCNHDHQLTLHAQVTDDQIYFYASLEPGPPFPAHIASFNHPWPGKEN
jgi:hypothetical protein